MKIEKRVYSAGMKLRSLLSIALLGLATGLASEANAQILTSPVSFTSDVETGGTLSAFNGWTFGYKFTANTTITVADLSVYDNGGSAGTGLNIAVPVGLWTSGGVLLGSVTVPAGSSTPILNDFRYAALSTPITLTAGQTYVVAASYVNGGSSGSQQLVLTGATDKIIDPSITYLSNASIDSPLPAFPNGAFNGTNGLFGGSFVEETATVPEPSAWALMAGGLGFLIAIQQRKRNLSL